MQRTPIGPTGAAIEKPIKMPRPRSSGVMERGLSDAPAPRLAVVQAREGDPDRLEQLVLSSRELGEVLARERYLDQLPAASDLVLETSGTLGPERAIAHFRLVDDGLPLARQPVPVFVHLFVRFFRRIERLQGDRQ